MPELVIGLLRRETETFLAEDPSLPELAEFIDALRDVDDALCKARSLACQRFAALLEAAGEDPRLLHDAWES